MSSEMTNSHWRWLTLSCCKLLSVWPKIKGFKTWHQIKYGIYYEQSLLGISSGHIRITIRTRTWEFKKSIIHLTLFHSQATELIFQASYNNSPHVLMATNMEENLQFNGFNWKPLLTEKLIKTLIHSGFHLSECGLPG